MKGSLLMLLNLLYASSLIAEPFCGCISAQTFDKTDCCPGHMSWEVNHINAFQYQVVGFHGV